MKSLLAIIIPCYNAKNTLFTTLSSISIQENISNFKVYLINDKSDYDYQEEVTIFQEHFPIEEIQLDKNLGPGGARREGILKTKEPYIMFIDSDDVLYDVFSLKNLYENIKNYDLCISSFLLERDHVRVIKKYNTIWLHGKIYKREFLEKYHINFNCTRANEDNGFNRLILLCKPKIHFIDNITYVYKDNKNSITRKNNRSYKIFGLEGFVDNMIWALEEALKRGIDSSFIPQLVTGVLVSMYYDYLLYSDLEESIYIIQYSKKIYPYYLKYPKISKNDLENTFKYKEQVFIEENKNYDKKISFDEFLRKVEDYD